VTNDRPDAVPEHGPDGPQVGLFLAFEGVEGSGKTTQATLLAEALRARGAEVVLAREPGSTPLGERVRGVVLDPGLQVPARSELFLMLAARAAFVEQVVRPGLEAGRVVIADRFELSTLAYQGAGRGLPPEEIIRSNRLATGGVAPRATLLLELPPEEGARRQAIAAKRPDRLEQEAEEFHARVARGYRDLADRVEGVIRVDAMGTVEEVRARLWAALREQFPETFGPAGGSDD
jgi:dTMP kinase